LLNHCATTSFTVHESGGQILDTKLQTGGGSLPRKQKSVIIIIIIIIIIHFSSLFFFVCLFFTKIPQVVGRAFKTSRGTVAYMKLIIELFSFPSAFFLFFLFL